MILFIIQLLFVIANSYVLYQHFVANNRQSPSALLLNGASLALNLPTMILFIVSLL
jgi:hypothetical protein